MNNSKCKFFSVNKRSKTRKFFFIVGLFLLLGIASMSYAQPYFVTEDLNSNRYYQLSNDTFQITLFYDGDTVNNPQLMVELYNSSTSSYYYISITGIDNFTTQVETREYYLDGYEPTGNVWVFNVVGNGGTDGLAFGFFWKNSTGDYYVAKSRNFPPFSSNPQANFVGAWPLGFTETWFESVTPQLTSIFGREQARMMIIGAQLLANGTYDILN